MAVASGDVFVERGFVSQEDFAFLGQFCAEVINLDIHHIHKILQHSGVIIALALIPQTSFRGETSVGVAKCRLFS